MVLFISLFMVGCLEKVADKRDPAPEKQEEAPPVPEIKEILVANPDLDGFAFERLSPTGKTIFLEARRYLEIQRASEYHGYAQPLQCAVNVSYVLERAGIKLPHHVTFAVPNILKHIKKNGGEVHVLPIYNQKDKKPLLDYIDEHFKEGLPAGALVAGCTVAHCDTTDYAEAHISILGDTNERGELMLYHNNWLRPNNTQGVRKPYMVSITNFYDRERPREWMATPWIFLDRNEDGSLKDLRSITPDIDDLDPLNGKYYISIALLPSLLKELKKGDDLKHHRLMVHNNPHREDLKDHPDNHRVVCRSPAKGLKVMDARKGSPGGALDTGLYEKLRPYGSSLIPYNSSFEFISLQEFHGWHSIKFYAINDYFGEKSGTHSIWVKDEHVSCKTQADWLGISS